MTTLGVLVEQTRRHLYGGVRIEMNRLTSSIDANATTLTCDYPIGTAQRGAYVTLGSEILYVWAADAATRALTVQRGMLGTAAAAHSSGALIEVNPRIPRPFVLDALVEELRSWGSTLPRIATQPFVFTWDQRAVDLGTSFASVYFLADARFSTATQPSPTWPRVDAHLSRSSAFPSGVGLVISGPLGENGTVVAHLALPFDLTGATEATTWTTLQLPPEWTDIASLGAAMRLIAPRDISRSDPSAQGEPRRSDEVPPGFALQTAVALGRLRDARIAQARNDLLARYPMRSW